MSIHNGCYIYGMLRRILITFHTVKHYWRLTSISLASRGIPYTLGRIWRSLLKDDSRTGGCAIAKPHPRDNLSERQVEIGKQTLSIHSLSRPSFFLFHDWGNGGAEKFIKTLAKGLSRNSPANLFLITQNKLTLEDSKIFTATVMSPSANIQALDMVEGLAKLVELSRSSHVIVGSPNLGTFSSFLSALSKTESLSSTRFSLVAFCKEPSLFGIDSSTPSRVLKKNFFGLGNHHISHLISDNLSYATSLGRTYGLDKAELISLAVPAGTESLELAVAAPESIRFLFIGRDTAQKNQKLAIRWSRKFGRNLGIMSPDEVPSDADSVTRISSWSDLTVRPRALLHVSRFDGTANSLIEAASLGIPVIGHRSAISREISEAYKGIIYFDKFTADSIEEAVRTLEEEYASVLKDAQESAKSISRLFNWENVDRTVEKLFDKPA